MRGAGQEWRNLAKYVHGETSVSYCLHSRYAISNRQIDEHNICPRGDKPMAFIGPIVFVLAPPSNLETLKLFLQEH